MLKSDDLINKVKSYNKFLNPETLSKAYDFALKAHEKQKRDEGSPYIIHPVAVANILTDLKLDSATIATGLLHDTIEDTQATYKTIEKEFGKEVADLVDGVTKISAYENQAASDSKAENFRKLILATSKDIRVLLVKLADRLHNMRTMESMSHEKQIKISSETLYIYAPIAHRIGLYEIKSELEDLSLKYTDNETYNSIKNSLEKSKDDQNLYIRNFARKISDKLKSESIFFKINGRSKSIFSIREKMIKKNIAIEEVYDRFAIRIIYNSNNNNDNNKHRIS